MKRYLLCALDDENYTEPKFYIYESREEAFKDAVEDCINAADGGDFQMKVENNQNRISEVYLPTLRIRQVAVIQNL